MKLVRLLMMFSTAYAIKNSSELFLSEGMDAVMTFRYESEFPTPFELGTGNGESFFTDGQFLSKHLSTSQLHRFEVHAWHSEYRRNTMIHFKIKKVHRTDGGTYYCRFGLSRRLQAVALYVNFPPGRVECQVYSLNESKWEMLKCSATGGSPRGIIMCYDAHSNGIPVKGDVVENETHIIQDILVRSNSSAYCCARNHASYSDECHEFILRREILEYGFKNVKTSATPSLTNKHTLVPTLTSIVEHANETKFSRNQWTYISLIAIAIAFVGLILTTICLCFVYKKYRNGPIVKMLGPEIDVELRAKQKLKSIGEDCEHSEQEPPSASYEEDI